MNVKPIDNPILPCHDRAGNSASALDHLPHATFRKPTFRKPTGPIIMLDRAKVKFNTYHGVVRPVLDTISRMGGVVGYKNPLMPEGAIVEVASMTKLQSRDATRGFGHDEDRRCAAEANAVPDGTRSSPVDTDTDPVDTDNGTLGASVDATGRDGRMTRKLPADLYRTEFRQKILARPAPLSNAEALILAERSKLSSTLKSKRVRAAARAASLVLTVVAGLTSVAGLTLSHAWAQNWPQDRSQSQVEFVSPEAALEQGLGAYRAGVYGIALPALSYAAEKKLLLGQYHLARLLADSATANTDHVRAYHLYREIVEEHASSIDVDDDARAPYVGKALTALARYIYRGLPEIGLQPNPTRAAAFLEEAATFFREPDGQFELAKLYLKGDGVQEDRRKSLHWLSTLSQDGHAGAQAFFADLLWTGKVVAKDEKRALALIRVAVENAPGSERIWIEDIYQRIFCGAPPGIRQQADGLVASYRQAYSPRISDPAEKVADQPVPTRTCGNGEALPKPQREGRAPAVSEPAQRAGATPPAMQGGMLGVRGR